MDGAQMPRLKRTHPGQPGISRRRRGRGWSYVDPDGAPISDAGIRARLDGLVIPPAWTDVWITPFANGHLQAVGTDAKGRRQYLYHDDWRSRQDLIKHQRVLRLGAALPKARGRALESFGHRGWDRERALAVAFRLLDRGHFRIGGAGYVQANGSYGLSTLLRTHVHRRNGALIFDYTAKSGVHRIERIDDEPLVEAVSSLVRRRSGSPEELLAYRTRSGWRALTGDEINEYVRSLTGVEVSAKDFRTWHGTVLGSVALAREELNRPAQRRWTERAASQAVRRSVVAVAENLGNTPAVCRASYVNPRAIDLFRSGTTIERAVVRAAGSAPNALHTTDPAAVAQVVAELGSAPQVERAVLRMLKE
jgi:DNA topoisomerase IB